MNYLLDTNVISELLRRQPDSNVLRWMEQLAENSLYISVLTLGELYKGVLRLEESSRRERLLQWLERDLSDWFAHRILPVDRTIAEKWGVLESVMGRTLPAIDALLAATALHHHLHLVTRNSQNFKFPGLMVVNPWHTLH